MPSKWDGPPDTYGLDYTGAHCRAGRHEKCPGYWGDSLRPGKGTRCACLCHEQVDEQGSGDGESPADQLTLFPTTSGPRRFIGPPSRGPKGRA